MIPDRSTPERIADGYMYPLTTKLWAKEKDGFIERRLALWPDSWTRAERAQREIEYVQSLHFGNRADMIIVGQRYVHELRLISEGATSKRKKKILSYSWKGSPEQLHQLYKALNGRYIEKLSFHNFKFVFSSVDCNELNPLRWLSDNATELLYFDHKLSMKYVDTSKQKYQRLKACIVKHDVTPFAESLRVLYQRCEVDLAVQKRKAIDTLLSGI